MFARRDRARAVPRVLYPDQGGGTKADPLCIRTYVRTCAHMWQTHTHKQTNRERRMDIAAQTPYNGARPRRQAADAKPWRMRVLAGHGVLGVLGLWSFPFFSHLFLYGAYSSLGSQHRSSETHVFTEYRICCIGWLGVFSSGVGSFYFDTSVIMRFLFMNMNTVTNTKNMNKNIHNITYARFS